MLAAWAKVTNGYAFKARGEKRDGFMNPWIYVYLKMKIVLQAVTAKQSRKTILNTFERYIHILSHCVCEYS